MFLLRPHGAFDLARHRAAELVRGVVDPRKLRAHSAGKALTTSLLTTVSDALRGKVDDCSRQQKFGEVTPWHARVNHRFTSSEALQVPGALETVSAMMGRSLMLDAAATAQHRSPLQVLSFASQPTELPWLHFSGAFLLRPRQLSARQRFTSSAQLAAADTAQLLRDALQPTPDRRNLTAWLPGEAFDQADGQPCDDWNAAMRAFRAHPGKPPERRARHPVAGTPGDAAVRESG